MKSNSSFNVSGAICGTVLAAALGPTVHAQETGDPPRARAAAIEEVVVTAQRREQSLRDVPISLEAVSGDFILNQGFSDAEALSRFSPSLDIDTGNQNDQAIRMRGVGTDSNSLSIEQAVPMFIDGVVFGRGSNAYSAFLDIQRVEILKGPQPIYFGQNATAGAISIITRRPGIEWEGYAVGEVGSNAMRKLEFGVGGPLTDTVGVRFAGKYDDDEGFMKDAISGSKFPERTASAGRAVLEWTPTDQLRVTAKIESSDISKAGRGTTPVAVTARDDEGRNVLFTDAFQAAWAIYDLETLNGINDLGISEGPYFFVPPLSVTRGSAPGPSVPHPVADLTGMADEINFRSRGDMALSHGYLEIDYEFANGMALTSQTGYSILDRDFLQHFGGGGPFIMTATNRFEDVTQWSQELRFTSVTGDFLEWMAGVYWQSIDMDTGSRSYRARLNPVPSFGGTRNHNNGINHQEDDRWLSAFASVTINPMDTVSIDLGGRFTEVKKEGGVIGFGSIWTLDGEPLLPEGEHGTRPDGMTPWAPTGESISAEFEESNFSPQVVVRWRATDDVSLYAKYSEAFKAGGFDSSVTQVITPEEAFVFESEFAESWEIGARSTLFDGLLALNATFFSNTFSDMQVSAYNDALLTTVMSNVAKQRVQGTEFDGRLAVSDNLMLSFAGTLMKGEIISFPGAGCTTAERQTGLCTGPGGTIDRSGDDALYTPEWTMVVGANYVAPVFNGYELTFTSNFVHSDGFDRDFNRMFVMDTYSDLNLDIGFGPEDGSWRFSVWGRNLLEPLPTYKPENDILGEGGQVTLRSSDFRTFGVQARINF